MLNKTVRLALALSVMMALCLDSVSWNVAAEVAPLSLIVIMADDLGAKELSCYGNQENHTPNLDRLAGPTCGNRPRRGSKTSSTSHSIDT